MEDFIFTPMVLAAGVAIHAFIRSRHSEAELRWLDFGFAAHVFSGFGQIWLNVYYYGATDINNRLDLTSYYYLGLPIAEALRYDFATFFPETLREFFHQEAHLPFDFIAGGPSSTMSMSAVYLLFLLGNSLYASSVAIAVGSYVAKVLIYRALRVEFPKHQEAVLIGALLMPSAVFWTSTLLKEPVMMCFFGPLFLAARMVIDGRRLIVAAVLAGVGAVGVALLKPYVLVAFLLSFAAWGLWQRVLKSGSSLVVKPLYLVLGLLTLVAASAAVDRLLPNTQERGLAGALAFQRRAAQGDEGGSNFNLEGAFRDANSTENTSLAAQVALAPLALATALYRPLLFEARSPVQLVNAIEATALLVLTIQLIRRYSWRRLVATVVGSPTLMFCATFTLIMALGTGLSTSNMGTLSRYRAPMMPFFVVLLLVARAKLSEEAAAAVEPTPTPEGARPGLS